MRNKPNVVLIPQGPAFEQSNAIMIIIIKMHVILYKYFYKHIYVNNKK